MNNVIRKIFTLLLTLFIIVSAFIPALSPLPIINNSNPEYSLFETFTNTLNSSNTSPISKWFNQLGKNFVKNYASDYLLFLDTLLFGALGVILIMLLIGVIITLTSKRSVGKFVRFAAILNTLVYIAIILLTYYQANKLYHDFYGFSSYFIKISPSIGAWVGLISSFVLIFVSVYGRSKTTPFQNNQNVMYPSQNPYPQPPPTANTQEHSYSQAQTTGGYNMSTRPEDAQNQEETEIARLGNGYMSNAVGAGALTSTGVTLTDKRMYLSGKLFKSDVDKNLKKTALTHVVDLQDIVGMEFRLKRKTGLLVAAIILCVFDLLVFFGMLSGGGANSFVLLLIMLLFIVSIGIFITYLNKGVTLFVVNTATGSIGFDVRFAGQATVERFAANIEAVKNAYKVQQGMSIETR